ncbi:3-oxoacyl-ACP synthase III [uncultured Gimesia sp.]|jgi:acyl-CoA:acyl-CoA alkyltransferase|uniref:3-oxoacyl-ACP synthase III n=1 Tax=uncultured Gimesia sp. TaxID=1678688 RepID=UPI0026302816|nr:3-oxoacyl-ACP synthase III [uncultured Gimesia sp.]
MRYEHVCIEAVSCILPPHVVTSDEMEARLAPVYERLGLPAGRLELMTGIRERRFFDPGTLPGTISALTVNRLLDQAQFDRKYIGALFHGSVCRDQLEPATASGVHHAAGLPHQALVLDISNACLGLLNGMVFLANMIEMGQIRAGVVVGTEVGRDLVEGTIEDLLNDPTLTRKSIKNDFASLTIGSGSAAILLCDRSLSRTGHRLLGGNFQTDTSHHELCAGGVEAQKHGDHRPRMQTDSESLLVAGVNLAIPTWEATKKTLGWNNADVDRVFTHQVGKAHRKLLLDQLGLNPELDYPTVETLGNTGAAALPMAWALGIENQILKEHDRVALLGIGSGLNSLMLGVQW